MRNRKLYILITLTVAVVFSLLIGELVCYLFYTNYYDGRPPHLNSLFKPDDLIGYRNKANFEARWGGIVYKTNAEGWREEREYQKEKPVNTYRIMVLGDSITFGMTGFKQTEIYPKLLEGLLNSNGRGMHYEVINAAVYGYSNSQEILYLKRYGLEYNPDLVIIGFCVNDLYPSENPFPQTAPPFYNTLSVSQIQNPLFQAASDTEAGRQSVFDRLYLRALFKRLWYSRKKIEKVRQKAVKTKEKLRSTAWKLIDNNLNELSTMAEKNNFKALLLFIPQHYMNYKENQNAAFITRLKNIAGKNNIPFLNLVPEFYNSHDIYNLYRMAGTISKYHDTIHLSKKGHKLTARVLYNYITRKPLN